MLGQFPIADGTLADDGAPSAGNIGVGQADGQASVSGVGQSTAAAAGEADGSASAQGQSPVSGAAGGSADVLGVSGDSIVLSTQSIEVVTTGSNPQVRLSTQCIEVIVALAAEADGSANVQGVGASIVGQGAEADGSATVTGVSSAIAASAGAAGGVASVSGAGGQIIGAAGAAGGVATVTGAGAATLSYTTFPTLPGIGWPVDRRPTFRTVVAKHPSAADVRTALWTYPLWEFEIVFEGLTASATEFPGLMAKSFQELMGFYLARGGPQEKFLFVDPDFNTVTGGLLGTGDGVTTEFLFLRVFGGFVEPVSTVVGTPALYVNSVPALSGWSVIQPNIVRFAVAPTLGDLISADFTYGFLCRFLEDTEDFEQMMINLWMLKSLKFRQVRTT